MDAMASLTSRQMGLNVQLPSKVQKSETASFRHFNGINGPFTVPGGTWPPARGTVEVNSMYDTGFSSFHSGGCHFLIADGSVHFLSQTIAQRVLAALTTRDGPSRSNRERFPTTVFSPEVLVSGPP